MDERRHTQRGIDPLVSPEFRSEGMLDMSDGMDLRDDPQLLDELDKQEPDPDVPAELEVAPDIEHPPHSGQHDSPQRHDPQ